MWVHEYPDHTAESQPSERDAASRTSQLFRQGTLEGSFARITALDTAEPPRESGDVLVGEPAGGWAVL